MSAASVPSLLSIQASIKSCTQAEKDFTPGIDKTPWRDAMFLVYTHRKKLTDFVIEPGLMS
ncbi:hypothetical protein AGR9A_Lc50104 [Agrobacterium salinitolerans str. Hayward 0363]|nr:hypothetical protein AGR9A_Lc50104 [Agrobacterium salinitolerans str. Hayward 0363]